MKELPLCPCELLIPVAFNDGTKVPNQTLLNIKMVLDRQFGGHRQLGIQPGSWHGQVESMIAIEVSVPENRIDALKKIVQAIGHELGQKKMYFKRGSPSVELLDPIESSNLFN